MIPTVANEFCHAGRDDVTATVVRSQPDPFCAAEVRLCRAVCLAILVLLAACADEGSPLLPIDQIRARFPPGGVVDVIEVDVVDRLPLRKAELIAPDGQVTSASYLNVNPSPSVTANQEFPNGPYAGNAFGVGNITAGVPLPALTGEAPQQRVVFLEMVATASIPLLDPVEYRRDWRGYHIRLSFGDPPGEVESRELAAPEPPPGG